MSTLRDFNVMDYFD